MAQRGVDVLVCCDPANMNWLTGYDGISFDAPHQYVVVASILDEPLLFGRPMDAGGAVRTTHLRPESILSWPESLVHKHSPGEHPMRHMMAHLRERGLLAAEGRAVQMACEMDHAYFTARALMEIELAIKTNGDRVEVVDGSLLVNWLRLVKSDAELEMMRRAAKVADATMTAALDTVAAGVRQCDVIGAVLEASVCGTAHVGEVAAALPRMSTGSDATAAHLTYTDEVLQPSRGTSLELAGCYRRYTCPIVRTAFLGEPPEKLEEVAAAVRASMQAALSASKEGNTAEDVWDAFHAVPNGLHGYTNASPLGYPVGIGYAPDWGEHTASIRPGDKTVLRKNMCWHFTVRVCMDDWSYELSEVLVVRGGTEPPECLHQTARELFVKPAPVEPMPLAELNLAVPLLPGPEAVLVY
eukprot:NODE_509_length_1510_cov_817.875601.p1 GENE.NODE_509_length_1510_cov_817.875601~~NODE_509_length_1510_cov_817.875601.p1  ORF type:complete len:469 (+),score=100.22 NODE_509_length_1510_cov_817.875601:169-1407(+)